MCKGGLKLPSKVHYHKVICKLLEHGYEIKNDCSNQICNIKTNRVRYNRNGKITLQSEKVGLKIVFIFFNTLSIQNSLYFCHFYLKRPNNMLHLPLADLRKLLSHKYSKYHTNTKKYHKLQVTANGQKVEVYVISWDINSEGKTRNLKKKIQTWDTSLCIF